MLRLSQLCAGTACNQGTYSWHTDEKSETDLCAEQGMLPVAEEQTEGTSQSEMLLLDAWNSNGIRCLCCFMHSQPSILL